MKAIGKPRKEYVSVLIAILAISWLIVVGWQAFTVFDLDYQRTSWATLPAYKRWLLSAGLAGWIGILSLVRLRYPRYLPSVATIGVGVICGALLITSQQLLAGLAVLWLGLVAWLIGLTTLSRLKVHLDPLSLVILSLTLGLGVLAILTLIMGLAGLLSTPWVLGCSGLLVLGLGTVSHRAIRTWGEEAATAWRNMPSMSWLELACFVFVSVFIVINWIGALIPEIMFDALKSHMALAKMYATDHRVTGIPYSMGSYWPMNGEMLFTLGYSLAGETAAKLFHFWAGVLAAGMVYIAGKRLDSRLTGGVAATVFYTTPIIAWESTTANIDLFWAMYVGGALVMLLIWLDAQRTGQVAAGIGLLLGFAMGIKPTAGYIAVGVGLVMLYSVWHDRSERWWADLWSVIVVTGVTALLGGIWYVRAYLLTGNPVFPFLNGIFRSPLWYPRNETFNYGTFGFGTTLSALTLLPWRLTYETKQFSEMENGALGMLFLAFIPLVVLVPKRIRRLGAVAFTTLVFGLLWAFSVQYLRYFIPAMVGLAIIAGWAMVIVWQKLKDKAPHLAWILPVFLVIFTGLNVLLALNLYRYTIPIRVLDQVVLGRMSREQYRAERIPSYKAFKYANEHLNKDARIYGVGECFQYLSDVPLIAPFFSIEGNEILFAESEASLRDALAASNITHLIINRPQIAAHWKFIVHSEPFLTAHTILEYAANNVYLYRLVQPQERAKLICPEHERLQNGSFEDLVEGQPMHWTPVGQPGIADISLESPSDGNVVWMSDSDYYFQTLDISAGSLYTLSGLARSAGKDPALIRLQVVWLDEQGQAVDYSIDVIEIGQEIQRVSMSATAPDLSSRALVYLLAHSGALYFDDASLLEVSREDCN